MFRFYKILCFIALIECPSEVDATGAFINIFFLEKLIRNKN